MPSIDQQNVIAFLGSAAAYEPRPDRVDQIETHGALVFLAGDIALKIKKDVRFDYMDFSTLELRRRACLRELEINKPRAPEIYLDVVPVTYEATGLLAIGGHGEPVEWAVRMRRFPQSDLLSTIADRGPLDASICHQLADAVAAYHRECSVADDHKGAAHLRHIAGSIGAELALHAPWITAADVEAFRKASARQIERVASLLSERGRNGYVRRCHGDLHLGNVVLWKAAPVLFDAIEFDEAIATIDVLYDLAFLLMDLDHRGQRQNANLVFNRYLWRCDAEQLEGLAAMPLFLALRAGIRAMVLAQRATQEHDAAREADLKRARAYAAHALEYLHPPTPLLVAVGGLSGSGKSTLAAALAPLIGSAPGAVHLRSDLERKALFKREPLDRLPPEAHSASTNETVYSILSQKAAIALRAGHSVIVDAVFAVPDERSAIEQCAQAAQVPFQGVWLDADPAVLRARVTKRRDDASDATAEVVQMQLAYDTGEISWTRIAAGGSVGSSLQAAARLLGID
jgi:uncharacterized protein